MHACVHAYANRLFDKRRPKEPPFEIDLTHLEHLLLRGVLGQVCAKGEDANLVARLLLVAHVGLRVLALTHKHHGQARDLQQRGVASVCVGGEHGSGR
jgi:hypothetical protein